VSLNGANETKPRLVRLFGTAVLVFSSPFGAEFEREPLLGSQTYDKQEPYNKGILKKVT